MSEITVKADVQPNPQVHKIITRRANGTRRVQTVIEGETMTQQQFQDQCDVNKIIEKYIKTGSVTHVRNAQTGVYADLTNLPDLMEAQNTIIQANNAFMEVPAQVRAKFDNDPSKFIAFLADSKNDKEAVELGLKSPISIQKPDPVVDELQKLNKNLQTKPKNKNQQSSDE